MQRKGRPSVRIDKGVRVFEQIKPLDAPAETLTVGAVTLQFSDTIVAEKTTELEPNGAFTKSRVMDVSFHASAPVTREGDDGFVWITPASE